MKKYDAANCGSLVAGCQGLVRSLAWNIHRKLPATVDLDDLIGYGQVGLVEAARDFDPARGYQFTTFAYYRIRGAILDGLSKMHWFNRADFDRGRYERMSNDVLRLEGDNQDEGGERLADDVAGEVRWMKGVSSALAMVYLVSQRGDADEGEMAVEDDSSVTPPREAMAREMRNKLNELIAALPEDAGQLIRAAYFEGLTLKEAGERLGISKAWASRLHAKTLAQLARSLRMLQLAD